MAELHVRNIPPELHQRLREQASSDGRSMSAEVIALLQQVLLETTDQMEKDRAAIQRLRDIRSRHRLPADIPPAEQLVREDRDSAH